MMATYEGADRVRGRGEKRGREEGEQGEGGGRRGGGRRENRGREEGEEGAGGGRTGGGRREKRGREEGEGRKKGREGERGNFCARAARAAPEGRRETRGREGEVRGRRGEKPTPLSTPSHIEHGIDQGEKNPSHTLYYKEWPTLVVKILQ